MVGQWSAVAVIEFAESESPRESDHGIASGAAMKEMAMVRSERAKSKAPECHLSFS